MGLDVVIRQVLLGSDTYHLVDDNLNPLPVCIMCPSYMELPSITFDPVSKLYVHLFICVDPTKHVGRAS